MKTILKITGYVLLSLTLFCCNDFEEAEPANNQMLWEDVFNDAQTARAAMTQVYADMRQNGFFTGNGNGIGCLAGCLADELVAYSNIPDSFQAFYTLQITDGSKTVKALWNSSYRQIYMCNAILQGVSQSTVLEEETKKQLRGEALFSRALVHFYLTNTFGDIPYITATDYNVNRKMGRIKPSEVYEKIVTDLEEAALLLSPQESPLKVYPSNKTVYAFLTRVHLYEKQYVKAYNVALSLLQDTEVNTLQPLEKVFLKESTGTLWQFAPATASANTLEGGFYVLAAAPSTRTALQPELVEAFSTDDLRKTSWIGSVTGSSVLHFPLKYKESRPSGASKEYSVVFRIEEQFLIAAEAAVLLRQWEAANHWLSVFKDSRGLEHVYSESEELLMTEIEQQRRLEFFTESGHRFYDLKRWNMLDQRMTHLKGNWANHFALLPIPQTELLLNPNLLPQNTGY
jgi:hypothetical protein